MRAKHVFFHGEKDEFLLLGGVVSANRSILDSEDTVIDLGFLDSKDMIVHPESKSVLILRGDEDVDLITKEFAEFLDSCREIKT